MSETVSAPSSGLVERVKNILLKPSPTWDAIATEPSDIKSIYLGYVIPLAAIGPISSAIGMSVIGVGAFGFSYKTPLMWAATGAIVQFVLALVMVFVMSLVIDGLAPSFGGQKNRLRAFKVAAYSGTAGWLAGIFAIVPPLAVLGLLGLYSLYLLYVGLPKLMDVPKEKAIGYTAVTVIIMIVLGFVFSLLSAPIYKFGMPGGFLSGAATGAAVGTATVPGVGSVDLNKMEQAAKQMEAQANAMQSGQTNVKTVDPAQLLALLPENYRGAARSDTSSEANQTGGVAVSGAKASYNVGGGTIRVEISDLGSMGGLTAMAGAFNVNSTETTETGYKKITSNNGRVVTEEYDNNAKSGSYSVLLAPRITVEARGDNVDMATIKGLVDGMDLARAESLAK